MHAWGRLLAAALAATSTVATIALPALADGTGDAWTDGAHIGTDASSGDTEVVMGHLGDDGTVHSSIQGPSQRTGTSSGGPKGEVSRTRRGLTRTLRRTETSVRWTPRRNDTASLISCAGGYHRREAHARVHTPRLADEP